MKKVDIIYSHGGGQLANQLWAHAHLLAFCFEHPGKFNLFNLAIKPYGDRITHEAYKYGSINSLLLQIAIYFTSPSFFRWAKYLDRNPPRLGIRALYIIGSIFPKTKLINAYESTGLGAPIAQKIDLFNANQGDLARIIDQSHTLLLCGFKFGSDNLLFKHRTDILTLLRLVATNMQKVDGFIERAKRKGDILCGVHIRQGDYKYFDDGASFYSAEQYAEVMTVFQSERSDCKVSFLICSNEEQSTEYFNMQNTTIVTGTTPSDDLTILSMCDYILGPPSSFGFWANYMGLNKRILIDADNFPFLKARTV